MTNEFLSKVFGAPVTSFTIDLATMAEGVLADAFRVKDIVYEKDGDGKPDKCYMKVQFGSRLRLSILPS